jgi:hypothetical protein
LTGGYPAADSARIFETKDSVNAVLTDEDGNISIYDLHSLPEGSDLTPSYSVRRAGTVVDVTADGAFVRFADGDLEFVPPPAETLTS